MEQTRGKQQEIVLDLTNKPISEQLRMVRCADNLALHELAVKLGFRVTDSSVLSRIETGKILPPKRFIEPLEQYLYGEER